MKQIIKAMNWKGKLIGYPEEDSYKIDKGVIAVADGVTRDPMEYLPNLKSIFGKLKFALNYPKPSPAKMAADIYTNSFVSVLKGFTNINQEAIKEGFTEANRNIKEWNDKNIPEINYTTKDFAGCVGSGVAFKDGVVYWGYISDCGIAIFKENGDLKFRTENIGPEKYDKYIWQDKRLQTIGWDNPEVRKIIRRDYRNNPKEDNSFGVLTGEEQALGYVQTGEHEIDPKDYVLVYSDGLEHTIFSKECANKLKQKDFRGLENLCKKQVATEGTLIITGGI